MEGTASGSTSPSPTAAARRSFARRDASRSVERGSLTAAEIDEALLAANLDTAGLPDLDLLIRTSGELRVSNFLLWQIAYAELHFTPVLWPDFTQEHFHEAIAAYGRRERRHGRVAADAEEVSC